MTRKDAVSVRLPVRRGLSEVEAATYISVSPSFFRRLVVDGRMPRPRLAGSRRIWDIEELDAAFRDLPREGEDGQPVKEVTENSWSDYE
ncbi:MAG: helix-turn-helix transcriptional regulator [Hyphomicrobiaceae bacterium]